MVQQVRLHTEDAGMTDYHGPRCPTLYIREAKCTCAKPIDPEFERGFDSGQRVERERMRPLLEAIRDRHFHEPDSDAMQYCADCRRHPYASPPHAEDCLVLRIAAELPPECDACKREAPLLCEAHVSVRPMTRMFQTADGQQAWIVEGLLTKAKEGDVLVFAGYDGGPEYNGRFLVAPDGTVIRLDEEDDTERCINCGTARADEDAECEERHEHEWPDDEQPGATT